MQFWLRPRHGEILYTPAGAGVGDREPPADVEPSVRPAADGAGVSVVEEAAEAGLKVGPGGPVARVQPQPAGQRRRLMRSPSDQSVSGLPRTKRHIAKW